MLLPGTIPQHLLLDVESDKAPVNCPLDGFLGGRFARVLSFQAIVPKQSLILFTARGPWIYARFPSANDMRRDPLQLLLKCIRDIGSAERDGPSLSPGEN